MSDLSNAIESFLIIHVCNMKNNLANAKRSNTFLIPSSFCYALTRLIIMRIHLYFMVHCWKKVVTAYLEVLKVIPTPKLPPSYLIFTWNIKETFLLQTYTLTKWKIFLSHSCFKSLDFKTPHHGSLQQDPHACFKMAMRHFGPLTEPPTASHTCWHIPPNLTYGHWYPKYITFWVKSTQF